MNIKECRTIKEYAQVVSQHLHDREIDNVLVGGACVSIYSNERYRSNDLDIMNIDEVPLSRIKDALQELGFEEKGRVFIHRDIEMSIDIVGPPLTIGEEHVKSVNEIIEDDKLLKLLSPTDSVKDRLAAYYYWNDQQALEQALMVCNENHIDIDNVREWSKKEGMIEEFTKFETEFDLLKKNIK